MKRTIIAAFIAVTAFTSAHAASINGLVNTGVGASGTADSNYSLSNKGVVSTPVITVNNVWPISPWLANTADSKWITPTSNQAQSFDPSSNGTYTYTLNFNLAGYDATSAALAGRFAADNSAVVLLNGTQIGSAGGFTSWSNFSTTAGNGFVAGDNKLEFVVTNFAGSSGNPTGLRVEFTSSNVAAVPEPETYAMLLAGLGMVGALARRRKQAA
ncbi:PEP-CTERM sorting domain-containing protein [Duganella fentianensis]|uniref:PEP-CTERM sorting domain-containing protein n=1 Tax=Duganella fentianensis TaxID=2692177 RepID=UPI0032B2ACB2